MELSIHTRFDLGTNKYQVLLLNTAGVTAVQYAVNDELAEEDAKNINKVLTVVNKLLEKFNEKR